MRKVISFLTIAAVLLFAISAMAQTKVVVIPLGGDENYMYWQGEWTDNTVYKVGDGVHIGGSSYMCIAAHTSSELDNSPPDETYWALIAKKGDTGATGPVPAIGTSCPQGQAVVGMDENGSFICEEFADNCSEVATTYCEAKGWTVVGEPLDGNIVCTPEGGSVGGNCGNCSNYNIIVWNDGSPERGCPPDTYSTLAGRVYSGHSPCECGDNLVLCGTWDMNNCIPD